MVNRFAGRCTACGGRVPAHGGHWTRAKGLRHLACESGPSVNVFVIGGKEFTRNAKGTCEDAPCCGCCTI